MSKIIVLHNKTLKLKNYALTAQWVYSLLLYHGASEK